MEVASSVQIEHVRDISEFKLTYGQLSRWSTNINVTSSSFLANLYCGSALQVSRVLLK